MQSIFLDGQGDAVVVIVRSDGIGGSEDLRRGVAHGYAQTGILDHRKVVAGIAHGHDLVTAQTQLFGQGQQAAALGNAGGVQLDVAAQAAGGLYVRAGGQHGAPGLVPQLHFGVHDAEFFHLADLLLQDGAQVRDLDAGLAEVVPHVFRHQHIDEVVVGLGGVAFAAHKQAEHAAEGLERIIDPQRILQREGLVDDMLAGDRKSVV